MLQLNVPSPLQKVNDSFLEEYGVELYIKRDDLIHPFISGNKWRKLKYNLLEAENQKKDTLLSFGGAFSNHIYALAAAGKELGFKTIGVIRGKDAFPENPTLKFAQEHGMLLHFVHRKDYKRKEEPDFIDDLKNQFGDFYLIPEGGSNELAIKGCMEIIKEIDIDFDYICCPCGTGATLAGISSALSEGKKAIGFSALKGDGYIEKEIALLTGNGFNNFEITYAYHFGGYAKITAELVKFIKFFEERTTIATDPVYTGKLFYGVYDLIKKNYFKPGERIICVHTGGLQGIEGMKQKMQDLLKQTS